MSFNWRAFVVSGMKQDRARRTTADRPCVPIQVEPLEPRMLLTATPAADDVFYDEYGDLTWAEGDLGLETDIVDGDESGGDGPEAGISGDDDISGINGGNYDLANTFKLESNAGSNFTIYLDFNGHTTSGTIWNSSYNSGNDIVTQAWSSDGDRSSFSTSEQQKIQRIWASVAEDFAPFDVNVTTQDPGDADLKKSGGGDTKWGIRVVIGPNSFYSSAGGVAYVGSFDWSSDTPAFVFNTSETAVREAISHEVGHSVGLSHDGNGSTSYYSGHGSGATSWAPIMGNSYSRSVTQWSKGEYNNASNTQDDLTIIATQNGFGYRTDDTGDSRGTATALTVSGTNINGQGIVEQNTDLDFFSFTTAAGTVSIDVDTALVGANLDALAKLYDSSGNLVATSNPSGSLSASFNLNLAAGTYYISIEGTGTGSGATAYTDYASLGNYWISGSVAAAAGNQDPVANNDSATTDEDDAFLIDVMGNDTDPESDTITITAVTNGSNGTATIMDGKVRYTPNANFNGSDSFTYTISDGNGGTDTGTVNVTVTAVPEIADITGPTGTDVDTTPTITWSSQSDADHYEVQVYRKSTGSLIASNNNVNGTSYTVGTPQAKGDFTVYVRAVNAGGKVGAWDTQEFTIAAPAIPTITGPSTSATDTTPTATWNSVTAADHYEVQIVRTSDGTVMFSSTNVATTSYTGGSSIAVGSYQVKVRAVNDADDQSGWSARNFTIVALSGPTITGPPSNSTDTTPKVTWNAVGGADHYEIQILRTSDNAVVASKSSTTGTSWTSAVIAVGDYQVRMRTYNDTGDAGVWATRNFTIDSIVAPGTVTITGPASSTNDSTPTVTWNAASNADYYEVLVYRLSKGQLVAKNNNVASTSYTISPALADDNYIVYVRGGNNAGAIGAWSSRSFTIDVNLKPGNVTITGPVGTTDDTTPTITWNAVGLADHYETLIYSTTRGKLIVSSNNVNGTSFTVGSAMANDNYCVYLRAVSSTGAKGSWTSRLFTVSNVVVPGGVTITGPASSTNDTTPKVTWNAATNAVSYRVQVYHNGHGKLVESITNVSGTSKTLKTLSSASYTVYVRAVSSTGTAGAWSSRVFAVDSNTAPGNVTITGPTSGTTDTTPTISWNSASNAVSYRVLLYSTTRGRLMLQDDNVAGTSRTVSTALSADSYIVYVRAVNASGVLGNWSSHNFNIAAAGPLEESEFLDMFWELSGSNERRHEVNGLWTV